MTSPEPPRPRRTSRVVPRHALQTGLALFATLATASCASQRVPKVPAVPPCAVTPARPAGDQLVFTSYRDGHNEIYLMNADGSGQTRLTHSEFPASGARWSRDGKTIFFWRDSTGTGGLQYFRMNADGSDEVRVRKEDYPAWNSRPSPERRIKLVVVDYNVCLASTDGSPPRPLSKRIVRDQLSEAWSPDGSRLAFVTTSTGSESPLFRYLYLIRADGTGFRELLQNVDYPVWSPDGSRLSVVASGEDSFYIVDVDGTRTIRVPRNSPPNRPTWSPDGKWLAYGMDGADGFQDVAIVNTECDCTYRLTALPGNDYGAEWRPRQN